MTVLNELDRFHLVISAIDRLPQTGAAGYRLQEQLREDLREHKRHIVQFGEDMPRIRNWQWDKGESRCASSP